MLYGDEEIIRARVAAQAKKRHSIDNAVEINGIKYTFARREFEYGFSMIVPESFEEMPKDVAKRRFPYEDRPKVIISSSDFMVSLAFNEGHSRGSNLEERIKAYRDYIKRIRPSNVFFTTGVYSLADDINVGHYDYRYPVVDTDLYNITFSIDLPDMELLGWFTCPVEMRIKWEPLARQMLQSIQLVTERSVVNG